MPRISGAVGKAAAAYLAERRWRWLYPRWNNFQKLLWWAMADPFHDEALAERMRQLRIHEEDLEESFIRGTGAGGQKINKTSSTVVLVHVPTGIEVRCQRERSQSLNRLVARQELCDKLEQKFKTLRQERRDAVEKKRRQNRKRPRGLQERILEHKHRRSAVKKNRGRIRGSE